MKAIEANGKTIQESFEEFDAEHPEVYELFKRYMNDLVEAQLRQGKTKEEIRISAALICQRIRWEQKITGRRAPNQSEDNVENQVFDDFKINNNFTSRYARKAQDELVLNGKIEFINLFNMRKLLS